MNVKKVISHGRCHLSSSSSTCSNDLSSPSEETASSSLSGESQRSTPSGRSRTCSSSYTTDCEPSLSSRSSSFSSTASSASLSSDIPCYPSRQQHSPIGKKPLAARGKGNKRKLEKFIDIAKPAPTHDLYTFTPYKISMSAEKKSIKNKKFYDNLFEKFPSAHRKKDTDASVITDLVKKHEEKNTEKTIVTIEEIKKEVFKRKSCKKLTMPWNNKLFTIYRLDKDDWACLTAAWQTDSLNRDLLFGTIMTESDYQRINAKDKKKLLMLFHPDKNRIDKSERLYNIIFKKMNGFYNNYKKDNE